MNISGKTKVIAIFGDPIEHTLSPAMHNAAFEAMGLAYAYIPFHIKPEGLGNAVRAIRSLGIVGANITVPHKERVMEFLDEVDPEAKRLGAVNTVVNKDGKLTGFNTDGRGFVRSLKEDAGFEPRMKRVFVCGSGGAARGICFALAGAGVRRIYLYDIDAPKRDRLVADINSAFGRDAARPSEPVPDFVRAADLVVNATPLGMRESDPLPLPEDSFRPGQVFYDIVYNPARTRAVAAAEAAGAKAANGLGMLLWQGVLAFEHWLGRTPPADIMRQALIKKS
ncbi:MAG TPA: shikimate dehydrogenase [Nitrospirota bacterium]|nr:shikimate dehydrogenase [Nitrospirota bacterium]